MVCGWDEKNTDSMGENSRNRNASPGIARCDALRWGRTERRHALSRIHVRTLVCWGAVRSYPCAYIEQNKKQSPALFSTFLWFGTAWLKGGLCRLVRPERKPLYIFDNLAALSDDCRSTKSRRHEHCRRRESNLHLERWTLP
jgi:hypothetical protein